MPKNITSNLDIFDFVISDEDEDKLDTVQGVATQKDPDSVEF
ncbi:hypothetical protein [Streptococcus hyovaginalis]